MTLPVTILSWSSQEFELVIDTESRLIMGKWRDDVRLVFLEFCRWKKILL